MTLSNGRTSAYQWDYGLKVNTTDAVGTKVRFANEHGSRSIVVEAVLEAPPNPTYRIPDILLTTGRAIVMYHLGGDGDTSVYTTSEDFLPVHEAPKPDDYIYTEEEIRKWQELDERLTEAEGDIDALDSGKADVVHTHTESDITDLGSYVPTSRTVNGKSLSSDISLSYTDVGAAAESHTHTESDITDLGSYVPTTRTVNGKALSSDITLSNTDVGAAASSHTHTESQITDLGDYISDPSTKSEGQVLTYNGSAWVAADGGGGGGTSDYTELSNKPSINSTTLSGDKTSSDLGLAAASHTHTESDITDLGDYIPLPSSPSNGDVLTYNSTDGEWGPQALPSSTEEIFVADVTTTYAQLTAARTAGKTLLFHISLTNENVTNNYWYSLERIDNDGVYYFYGMRDGDTVQWQSLGASGVWTGGQIDIVPTTRTINSKTLSSDVTLTASDVGAVPTTRTVNSKALSSDITLSASDVSAVPTTRKVNNKALSSDITLSASDVSAVPTSRKVNNYALSSDVTLGASDVGAIAAPSSASSGDVIAYTNGSWSAKALTPTDIGAMPAPYSSFSTTDGDIIIWDSDNGRWAVHTPEPSDVGAAAASHTHTESDITDLGDYIADPSTKSNGQVLTYNGSAWVAQTPSSGGTSDYDDLTDKPSINSVTLSGDKTSSDLGLAAASHNHAITGLSDVFLATYNSTTIAELDAAYAAGKKIFLATSTQMNPLCGHSFSPKYYTFLGASGEDNNISVISCHGSGGATTWASEMHSYLWVYAPYEPPSDGDVVTYDSGYWYSRPISLSASDVGAIAEPSSASDGNVLSYDSQDGWVAGNLSASDVGAIPLPSSASSGQFLVYNGSAWVAQSLSTWQGGSY